MPVKVSWRKRVPDRGCRKWDPLKLGITLVSDSGRAGIQLRFHIVESSATMNAWTGIAIGRPDWLSGVAFRVGDETVCALVTSAKN